MIECLFLLSRQGKVRLTKWYKHTIPDDKKLKLIKEINGIVLSRSSRLCGILEYNDQKVVYKRYASLFFVTLVSQTMNELKVLEVLHHFVECLDKYFGNVCELDLIFNFHQAYYILDEIMIGGHVMEPSKKVILKSISSQEAMESEQK